MPISRVELNAGRQRFRRDNRQLRLTPRLSQNNENDTRPNALAETRVVSTDHSVSSTATESHDRGSILTAEQLDSRLCDQKAIISGTSPAPTDSIATTSYPSSDKLPPESTDTPESSVAADTPVTDRTADDVSKSSPPAFDPKVGQSRLDPITGEWTWFATMRSQRPDQFGNVVVKPSTEIDCPFCAGAEHRTPNPVWIASLDESGVPNSASTGSDHADSDWTVRVVPNLYPAVASLEDAGARTPASPSCCGRQAETEAMPHSARLYRATASFESFEHAQAAYQDRKALKSHSAINRLFPAEAAMGGHEVIIESPRHTESLGELNTAEVALVFAAYSQRIRYWREVPGVQHVSIFKNVGRDAGASLLHSHSQLIATNRVPTVVQLVTRRLQAHHARLGSCLQCDLLRGELEQESRVISQTDSFVAYCPFASRFPLQVRVTSKEHLPCFSDLRTQPLAELARLTLRVVRWLEALRPGTAYNMLIHNCPVDFRGARESQHWAMDIFPRVSRLAGFELATGAMINPVYPETAAKAYRAQARLSDPRYVLR